jgi:DNA replication protein DnaC
MSDTPQVLLAHHLKVLRLPTFLREYDKLARQCAADRDRLPRYLLRLSELEMIDRERRTIERRIKETRFPAVKSLDSFDFAAIPSLNKTLVLELARSEYVARRENIIAIGNSGTGKTHVALGLAACQKVSRSASPPPPPWSTSCTKRAMKSVCCASNVSSPATSS